jgi:hypothetical protein
MKNSMYLKQMMVIVFLLFSYFGFSQKQEESSFFIIENLSAKTYSAWYNSINLEDQSAVLYSCIPAKVIGVKKDFVEKFKATTKQMNFSITMFEISAKEAEIKCAEQRKL